MNPWGPSGDPDSRYGRPGDQLKHPYLVIAGLLVLIALGFAALLWLSS